MGETNVTLASMTEGWHAYRTRVNAALADRAAQPQSPSERVRRNH
jgi:hypothetical protein